MAVRVDYEFPCKVLHVLFVDITNVCSMCIHGIDSIGNFNETITSTVRKTHNKSLTFLTLTSDSMLPTRQELCTGFVSLLGIISLVGLCVRGWYIARFTMLCCQLGTPALDVVCVHDAGIVFWSTD